MNRTFQISIIRNADGDLAGIRTVTGGAAMEDLVTELHREFPAPEFRTDVTFA